MLRLLLARLYFQKDWLVKLSHNFLYLLGNTGVFFLQLFFFAFLCQWWWWLCFLLERFLSCLFRILVESGRFGVRLVVFLSLLFYWLCLDLWWLCQECLVCLFVANNALAFCFWLWKDLAVLRFVLVACHLCLFFLSTIALICS